MIREFHVQNYKKFQDLKVTGLGRLSVIGGMNNVGKTSLLEAIYLLFDRLNPGMLLQALALRGLTTTGGTFWPFASSYHKFDISQPILLEGSDGPRSWRTEISRDPSSKLMRVYLTPRPGGLPSPAANRSGDDPTENILKIHYFQDNEDLGVATLVNRQSHLDLDVGDLKKRLEPNAIGFLSPRGWLNARQMAEVYSALELQGELKYVSDILHVIEPQLLSLTTVAADGTVALFADVGLGPKVAIPLLGDGTNRILSLVLALAQARHGILFVDEFDNGLHYSVLAGIWTKLMMAAEYFDCQVIASTHSYALLQAAIEAFGKDAKPDFSYVRLQESPSGIIARSYAFDELSAAIGEGWEVR